MRENSDDTEKLIIEENKEQEQEKEALKEYQQLYNTKICAEVLDGNMLDYDETNPAQNSQKCSCLTIPSYFLIYSIIVAIFAVAGFILRLSNNEGYNFYKEILEKNITILEINNTFPDEKETFKLLAYLNRDKGEDSSCTYLKFSLSHCFEKDYRMYCNSEKYNEKKCNYMDRQYYLGYNFICNEDNYKNRLCDEIQYNDYLYTLNPYKKKIKIFRSDKAEISLTSFTLEKMWCNIGNYDFKIYLSFLIFLGIFILLLIFDTIMIKRNLQPGISYYIIITLYMFYYVIFKVYIILFLLLFLYSIFVVAFQIDTYSGTIIIYPTLTTWMDKRINALIFCGITLILFIMTIFLSNLKRIIYNHLSFRFDGKIINKDIIRKASITIGDNKYKFELAQNRNLCLNEIRKHIQYYFQEISLDNNTYYLKNNNIYLKDQLNWANITYLQNNLLFTKPLRALKLILANLVCFLFFQFLAKNDICSDYYQYLLDLGYEPEFNLYIQICFYLNRYLFNIITYPSILIGIWTLLSLYLRIIFGGFSKKIFISLKISFVIILSIITFALFLFSIAGCASNIFFSFAFLKTNEIKFTNVYFYLRSWYLSGLYQYLFIIFIILFITLIKLIPSLKTIQSERTKLLTLNNKSEDVFMFKSIDDKNYILEAVDLNNFPKHLIYTKKLNPNPFKLEAPNLENLGQASPNIILCFELNNEMATDVKQKKNIQYYNYQEFRTTKKIRNCIFLVLGILILSIASFIISFKNNKYYDEYRDYFIEIDKTFIKLLNINTNNSNINSILPSYTQFWCKVGIFEKYILVSLIVFSSLYLLFLIISILIHKNCLCRLNYDNGKSILYKNLIIINTIILFAVYIFFSLSFYLFVYTFAVSLVNPDKNILLFESSLADKNPQINDLENNWNDNKIKHFFNIPIQWLIFFLLALLTENRHLIIDYLNMNYQEKNDQEEKINESNENKNDIELNEKRANIIINNINYNVRIKLNHVLYLQRSDNNKIYKFKKILIENLTNNFVYVRIGANSITELISHAEWNYPNINYIFLQLFNISYSILVIFLFSIPLFELSLQNNFTYRGISTLNDDKPLFFDVFAFYGKFEDVYMKIRFSACIINLFILILVMIKRMLIGGYKNMTYSSIGYFYSVFFVIQISIFVLTDFIIILFAIFSIVCYYKNFSSISTDNILPILYIQTFIYLMIIINNIRLLIQGIKLMKDIKQLRNAIINFIQRTDNFDDDEGDINFRPVEFRFISLDGKICSIKEYKNPLLQRFLYYYEDNKNNNIPSQKNNKIINKEINNNNTTNNNIVITNNINENKNILDNNPNIIEIEMQKANSDDSFK